MAERSRRGTQRLALDGDWTLFEFSQFARTYSQVYSVLYALDPRLSSDPEDEEFERIHHLFNAFPWRGGYSAVNFYESLRYRVPKQDRPVIKSIRYESPGWIELSLIVGVALSIKSMIACTTSPTHVNDRRCSPLPYTVIGSPSRAWLTNRGTTMP